MQFANYIPIITTIFSIYFSIEILKHYLKRRTPYLLWWTLGVVTFGMGTLAESINILAGWNPVNLKFWYIVGALLGGFPLAQGTVYLLMKRKFANISAWVLSLIVVFAAIFVLLTPIAIPPGFQFKLTGAVFAWKWVRIFSPFINLYSLIFLVGGAVYSAYKYYRMKQKEELYKGNILIAIGGLLPGIGGTFTRFGIVEMLFITELIGLYLIFIGYKTVRNTKRNLSNQNQNK